MENSCDISIRAKPKNNLVLRSGRHAKNSAYTFHFTCVFSSDLFTIISFKELSIEFFNAFELHESGVLSSKRQFLMFNLLLSYSFKNDRLLQVEVRTPLRPATCNQIALISHNPTLEFVVQILQAAYNFRWIFFMHMIDQLSYLVTTRK